MYPAAIRSQFGAALTMLERAISACPETLWGDSTQSTLFWYTAYHALFWTDLYLSGDAAGFAPPAPFGLEELDPTGVLPPRVYTQAELLAYLAYDREKMRATLDALTDEQAARLCTFPWGALNYAELLLDSMRHVQGHAADLGLILGQQLGTGPGWVARSK